MRIAIVNAVYPPEPVVSAQLGRDIATYVARNGHDVTVLCPTPSRPAVRDYSAYAAESQPRITKEDEVTVVRLPSYTAPQSKVIPRMRESHSFGRIACNYLEDSLKELDVVYVNSWPLLSQAMVAKYCQRNNVPLVLHIQDIYPESLTRKLPKWLGRLAAYPLLKLDRSTAQKAAKVLVISDNMKQVYLESRGVAETDLIKVLFWIDEEPFHEMPSRQEACDHYEIDPSQFTFFFLGNIGPVAGVELLIEAFHNADLKQAQLVIAGDGSAKQSCVAFAEKLGVSGVHFVSDPDVNNTPLLQSLGHVALLPVKRGAGMSSIPSKLMAYLMSSKPVIATVDGGSDTARCIVDGECGWLGEPEDSAWLTAQLKLVSRLSMDSIRSIGENGKAFGLANFAKGPGLQRIESVFRQVAGA